MKTNDPVDGYIAKFPREIQRKLMEIRAAIRQEVPAGTEEKISYGIPTFFFRRNLVHFAAFRDHISFFPTGSGIAKFRNELGKYKLSKGTVQIPLDQELPIPLIRKIVRFRVNEELTRNKQNP